LESDLQRELVTSQKMHQKASSKNVRIMVLLSYKLLKLHFISHCSPQSAYMGGYENQKSKQESAYGT